MREDTNLKESEESVDEVVSKHHMIVHILATHQCTPFMSTQVVPSQCIAPAAADTMKELKNVKTQLSDWITREQNIAQGYSVTRELQKALGDIFPPTNSRQGM